MLYTRTHFLMGTDITISIVSTKNCIDAIYEGFGIFASYEKEFSRFLESSDLCRLNAEKEREVSSRFIDVLQQAKDVYERSDGFFNPLVDVRRIGYSRDFSRGEFIQESGEENKDFDHVQVFGDIVSLQKGQKLDLGGIVKGYTVDVVSGYLREKGYHDFIVNAGGDIYLSGNTVDGDTPIVAIDNPFHTDQVMATLVLKDMAISTSGTYKRQWDIGNKHYHHILDPKSEENHMEIVSVSIIAPTCSLADMYATTCIAMGYERAVQFLAQERIDAVMILSDRTVYQTEGLGKYGIQLFT
ncbi:MAG: FAD:protein FMN transferase [Candidatus Peribacteria bacterium]|nr:MAG: FAD:protein FMN transferase [Candidatus Peribacteria bacterium]